MKNLNANNKIRKLREQNGWSQKKLAQIINLSQSSIAKIENGNYKLKNLNIVNKFIKIFNVSFDFLFEDDLIACKKNNKSVFTKQAENELYQMNSKQLELSYDIICKFIEYKKNINNN